MAWSSTNLLLQYSIFKNNIKANRIATAMTWGKPLILTILHLLGLNT